MSTLSPYHSVVSLLYDIARTLYRHVAGYHHKVIMYYVCIYIYILFLSLLFPQKAAPQNHPKVEHVCVETHAGLEIPSVEREINEINARFIHFHLFSIAMFNCQRVACLPCIVHRQCYAFLWKVAIDLWKLLVRSD